MYTAFRLVKRMFVFIINNGSIFFFNIHTIKESMGIKRNTNLASWKHTYIILTPQAKPHFYIVKPGFKEVYIFFLISAQKRRLWVLVRTAPAKRF